MIFEKKELSDGGPNDKGTVIGHIMAESIEEANEILNVDHGFIILNEISMETYLERLTVASQELSRFRLQTEKE